MAILRIDEMKVAILEKIIYVITIYKLLQKIWPHEWST